MHTIYATFLRAFEVAVFALGAAAILYAATLRVY